jgi:hypothetical protein
LLGFIETMDFIDKENGALAMIFSSVGGRRDRLSNVFNSCQNRIEGNEVRLGGVGNNTAIRFLTQFRESSRK